MVSDNKRVKNAQIAQSSHGAVVEMQRLMELEKTTTALSKRMERLAWIVTILTGVLLILAPYSSTASFVDATSSS
jgi:hypothetical protein